MNSKLKGKNKNKMQRKKNVNKYNRIRKKIGINYKKSVKEI